MKTAISPKTFIAALIGSLALLTIGTVCAAQDEDSQSLELFGGGANELITAARSPRPPSQIAENVTVITAAQIAEMNAHTLADVLQTVPGIQFDQVQTPGSFAFFYLQSANSTHIQVLVDGVPQNNLLQSQIPPGFIPVQQIERVEIIKGAASAAWGQALGGVVNVVTKNPNSESLVSGGVSVSYGEASTRDLRAELSGTRGRVGYYLTGGNLYSKGLLPNNGADQKHLYVKLTYDLPVKGTVTFGLDLSDAFTGLDETEVFHDTAKFSHHYSFLRFDYPLDQHFDLEVGLRESRKDDHAKWGSFNPDGSVHVDNDFVLRESTYAATAKLSWSKAQHRVVTGFEYEHDKVRQKDELIPDSAFMTDRTADKTAVYSNGAFTFGAFTLLPGVRFDHTGLSGDAFSYTLGATYLLTEKTVLRGYAAKGYSLPIAIFLHGLQRVRTTQVGIETSDVPYVWLKGTLFYNQVTNVEGTSFADRTLTVFNKQIRQGGEIEARTVPLGGFSLTGGYTYADVRDDATGIRIPDVPVHLAKLGLHYDNKQMGLSGILFGNYVVRYLDDGANGVRNPNDRGTLWDLSLTQRLGSGENSPELFFSAHNIFNGTQYLSDLFKNAGRWVEGGVRCKF